jgi:hypothetical protein
MFVPWTLPEIQDRVEHIRVLGEGTHGREMGRLSNRTFFFATHIDLQGVFATVEGDAPLSYYECGNYEIPTLHTYLAGLQIPHLGESESGGRAIRQLLVAEPEYQIRIEAVRQRRGGVLHFVDARRNPDVAILNPGGIFRDECVIQGEIAALANPSPKSRQIYRRFHRAMRFAFRRIDMYYVGEESYRFFRAGYRLTQHYQSPPEYDLVE